MARAKGREEFFEVFRTNRGKNDQDDRPAEPVTKPADVEPPQKPAEHEHVEVDPGKPSSAIYYHAGIQHENTDGLSRGVLKSSIALRRDSIIYAAISVVLLLILSYVIGYDRGRHSGGEGSDLATRVAANEGTPGARQGSILTAVRTETPLAGRFEIQMATLGKANSQTKALGEEAVAELNAMASFRDLGLEAYTAAVGDQQVLRARGGFASDRDERAQNVLRTIQTLVYQGRKDDFKTAMFVAVDGR